MRRLDIGCGKNKRDGFIGVDIDPSSDADVVASATNLPFKDCSVDTVNCSHLLEHLYPQEAHAFFDEVHRVLKPGGNAYIKIDRDWSTGRLLRKDPEHKYRYEPDEIKEMLHKFSIKKVKKVMYLYKFIPKNKIFVEVKK